jgi:hypothetical protein
MARNVVWRAVEAVGGPTRASHICQVSAAAIYKWRLKGYIQHGPAASKLAAAARKAGYQITTDDLVARAA